MESIVDSAKRVFEEIQKKYPSLEMSSRVNPSTKVLVIEMSGNNRTRIQAFSTADRIITDSGFTPLLAGWTSEGRYGEEGWIIIKP